MSLKSTADEGTGNAEKQFKLELIINTVSEVFRQELLISSRSSDLVKTKLDDKGEE